MKSPLISKRLLHQPLTVRMIGVDGDHQISFTIALKILIDVGLSLLCSSSSLILFLILLASVTESETLSEKVSTGNPTQAERSLELRDKGAVTGLLASYGSRSGLLRGEDPALPALDPPETEYGGKKNKPA